MIYIHYLYFLVLFSGDFHQLDILCQSIFYSLNNFYSFIIHILISFINVVIIVGIGIALYKGK
jgi:hypothetical protein